MLLRRKKAVVAIPVYKKEPSDLEMFSFAQVLKVLGSHPICLFYPNGLDLTKYTKVASGLKPDISLRAFPEKYFSGIDGYNQLMLSYNFYNSFSGYEYLLLYQLDAFVFEDRLIAWCNKGFDYIGAPWFRDYDADYQSREIVGVGNGGFSLRKIWSMIKAIHTKPYHSLSEARDYFAVNGVSKLGRIAKVNELVSYLFLNKYQENTLLHDYPYFEDLFWANDAIKSYSKLNLAPSMEALNFAFECNPSYCYELNQYRLPFGCHGWYKYDKTFWRQFIKGVSF
jgi:hypothetical protein